MPDTTAGDGIGSVEDCMVSMNKGKEPKNRIPSEYQELKKAVRENTKYRHKASTVVAVLLWVVSITLAVIAIMK